MNYTIPNMLTRYYDVNVKINNRISTNPKEITVIVFLDIYQAFVTVEHPFLYEISFQWEKCYMQIAATVSTSNRLLVHWSAVFLYFIVVELL